MKVILSDTVGFISDLPTELIAAFRATLEEVLAADLILHVRDISTDLTDTQALEVRKILNNLGVSNSIPVIELWNKIDKIDPENEKNFQNIAKRKQEIVPISALTGKGVLTLLKNIKDQLGPEKFSEKLFIPFEFGKKKAWLHENGIIIKELYTDSGFELEVMWSDQQKKFYDSITQ